MDKYKNNESEEFDIALLKDFFDICLEKWYWFIISVVISMVLGFIYIRITPTSYVRTSSILIKDDYKSGSVTNGMFTELDMLHTNSNMYNEMIAIKSPLVISKVVDRLKLNISYLTQSRFGFAPGVLYAKQLPFTVVFSNLTDKENATMLAKLNDDNNIVFYDFTKGKDELNSKDIIVKPGSKAKTPLGEIVVIPGEAFEHWKETRSTIKVKHVSRKLAEDAIAARLTVELNAEEASVIDIKYTDTSVARAEDILANIINVYNELWIEDRNQASLNTKDLINERLAELEKDLGTVDENISSFKSKNLLPTDIRTASTLYMQEATHNNEAMFNLNNQLAIATYIREFTANHSNNTQILPTNSGLTSAAIETQIQNYNTTMIRRNSLVSSSSEKNPLVENLDETLGSMRKAIIASLDNLISSIRTQISNQSIQVAQNNSQIAQTPEQEKYLLSVERQQKVKEQLYLYLLEKREENELTKAFTAYNTRIIAPPSGSDVPVSPRKTMIYMLTFVLGLVIPAGTIYAKLAFNNSVQSRKDLEVLSIPFMGEIPSAQKNGGFIPNILHRQNSNDESQEIDIVVKENGRNGINEAFRLVRSNMDFIIGRHTKTPVLMITSANPGSGKTFTTINLALTIALNDKRVLIFDLDLRKATLSNKIGLFKNGISNVLIGKSSIQEAVVKTSIHPNIDFVPVGTIPPNPYELLSTGILKEIVDSIRDNYDYIFIDCPPIEIVADTLLINEVIDSTIFIARANNLSKTMLPMIEDYHKKQKLKNMAIILNGTTIRRANYGYGYGYKESKKKKKK